MSLRDELGPQGQLACFRIKELKDALHRLGIAKAGKKQVQCRPVLLPQVTGGGFFLVELEAAMLSMLQVGGR